jgi:hypothetical protein
MEEFQLRADHPLLGVHLSVRAWPAAAHAQPLGWRRWLPRWLDACVAGAPTSAFARRPAYSSTSMHTSATVYGWSCGISGAPIAIATGSYAVAGYRSFTQRWRLGPDGTVAYVWSSGVSADLPQRLLRFNRTPSSCAHFKCLSPSNRRGTCPVCPVVWEG